MKINEEVATKTHSDKQTDLQHALAEIVPAALSISLSIRELIRQGYLYGALVLLRPLAERSITALYLKQSPNALQIWIAGWEYNKRPKLNKMINELWGAEFPNAAKAITTTLNSLVHGDPESAKWNLIQGKNNSHSYAVSKILNRPDICEHAALEAATWLCELSGIMLEVFINKKNT